MTAQEANRNQNLDEESSTGYSQDNLDALQDLLREEPYALQFNASGVVGAVETPGQPHNDMDINRGLPSEPAQASPPPEERGESNITSSLDGTIAVVLLPATAPPSSAPIIHSIVSTLPREPRIAELCEMVLDHPNLEDNGILARIRNNESDFTIVLLRNHNFQILTRRDMSSAHAAGSIQVVGPLNAVLDGAAGSIEALPSTGVPMEHQVNPHQPVSLVHLVEHIDRLIESQRIVWTIRTRLQSRLSAFAGPPQQMHQYIHTVYLSIACYMFFRNIFEELWGPSTSLPLDLNAAQTPLNRLHGQPVIGMHHLIQTLPTLLNEEEQHLALSLGNRIHRLLSQGRLTLGSQASLASPSLLDVILQHNPHTASMDEAGRVIHIQRADVEGVLDTLED